MNDTSHQIAYSMRVLAEASLKIKEAFITINHLSDAVGICLYTSYSTIPALTLI